MHIWLTYLFVRNAQKIYTTNSNRFVGHRMKTRLGQDISLYLAQPYGTVPVAIRDAEIILPSRKLLKSHLFDLAFPPQLLSSLALC